ncbi:MAG: TonB-dependent receptor [Bacteroidales bacterium]|nr:TonB-dependent receptor [Bacteroidales bacterium]
MSMLRKVLLTIGLLLATNAALFAQGTLTGTVIDSKTKEPMPFVNVVAKQDGNVIRGGQTDFDGVYTIKPLPVGKYDIEVSYVGYQRYTRKGVQVKASGFSIADVELVPTATTLEAVEIVEEKNPPFEIGTAESGQRLNPDDIARMPATSVDGIVAAVGGVGYSDGGSGTARGESGMVTMQGGVRKRGGVEPPKEAIAEIQVILGGTPASIGEAIGGTQIITLKPPSNQFKGVLRWESYIDYRHINALSMYLTGPLYKKNVLSADGTSSYERTMIGFRLTGQASTYYGMGYRVKDHRYQIVKDEYVRQYEQNPLAYDPLTGAINYAAETGLYKEHFEPITRLTKNNFGGDASRVPNLQNYGIGLEGSLNFSFSDYVTLVLTGEYSYSYSPNTSLMPLGMSLAGNSISRGQNMGLTVDFTQRFKDPEQSADNTDPEAKSALPITNVMYNITAMVQHQTSRTYNSAYGGSMNDIFRYGHIGKFVNNQEPTYEMAVIDYYGTSQIAKVQNNWQDNIQYVEPSKWNPILANYNNQLYSINDINWLLINRDNILGYKGLMNGDSPSDIMGMLNNVGVQSSSFAKSQADFFYFQAKASAQIKGHDIEVGFQYDKYWSSSYGLGVYNLWTIMRNDANRHVSQMDLKNPIYSWDNTTLQVNYDRLYNEDQQTQFSRNMREWLSKNAERLGITDPGKTGWLDIDRYDPEVFAEAGGITMFSANELFNSGNQIVSYYGYDHTGKKYNARSWQLNDFFKPTEDGFQYLPSFSPTYMAGYVQDQFRFQDLIFNIGVRVDYFDGNQFVLKDPYLLYQSYQVGEIRQYYSRADEWRRDHPTLSASEAPTVKDGASALYSGAGDDWVVYVDDPGLENPTIKGYRDQNGNWYNAKGVQVASPSSISGISGKPTPYRTKGPEGGQTMDTLGNMPDGSGYKVDVNAFERYKPQVVAMPRVAFSFPVGDNSQFKASYDIIARRPSSGWQADYLDYLYMTQRSSTSNPNLKPEKITNYEIGFQQALTQSSAISISAYYKETRDLIQLVQYNGADPNPNYYSYDNLDFRTIKGLTIAYDLRQTKNIRINANYTLQYAEGTGLSTTTMTELIKEGYTTLKMLNPISDDRRHEFKANVDFRYFDGARYNGPVITRVVTDSTGEKRRKEIKLLENFGVNFLAVAQSGRPYTKAFSNKQSTIVGSYRGARLPWGFYFNVILDKTWPITIKTKNSEGRTKTRQTFLTTAITVNNLFNIRNVINVFPVTGNPEDDGYLTDPETQREINAWLDPDSFRDLYTVAYLNNSVWNYSSPRTVILTVSYNF